MRRFLLIMFTLMLVSHATADTINYVREVYVDTDTANYLYQYYYNPSSQLVMELQRIQAGPSKWNNVARTEWFYDEDNLIRQQLEKVEGDEWQVVQTEDITYINGQIASQTNTDAVTGDVMHTAYTYTDGRVSARVHKLNGVQDYAYAYTYNAQGQLQSTAITTPDAQSQILYTWKGTLPETQTIQLWENDEWVNQMRYTFFYQEGEEQPVKIKSSIWKHTNKGWEWINQQTSVYDYQADNLVSEVNQYWAQMFWQDQFRFTYTYADGKLSCRNYDLPVYRKWRTQSYIQYEYEANRETATSVYEFWGGEEGEGFLTALPVRLSMQEPVTTKVGNRIQVNYGTSPLVSVDEVEAALLTVLPNPSDGVYYISTADNEGISWVVYDLQGRVVAQQTATASRMVDITSAPDGIYLIRLITPHGELYSKLIKK